MAGRRKYTDKKKREVICGDSWFTNYHTVKAMSLDGFHYFSWVKTGHSRIPKLFLEQEMAGYCPGSWLVLLHTSPSNVEMTCLGYKYNRSKILTFVMTKGCGNTTPGDPYHVTFTKKNGERIERDIAGPEVVTNYFCAAGGIDHHNHSRQGTLGLEEKWVTQCGYFHIFTTMVGIIATDSWLSWRYEMEWQATGQRGKDKNPDWNIGMPEFAERLTFSILERHSQEALLKRRKRPPLPVAPPPDPDEQITSPSNRGDSDDSST